MNLTNLKDAIAAAEAAAPTDELTDVRVTVVDDDGNVRGIDSIGLNVRTGTFNASLEPLDEDD